MWTDSAAPLLLCQEVKAILYSRLPDGSVWVWNRSDTNGNIAGGRSGPCCANKGNYGWHKLCFFLSFFFFFKCGLKIIFLWLKMRPGMCCCTHFLLRRKVVGEETFAQLWLHKSCSHSRWDLSSWMASVCPVLLTAVSSMPLRTVVGCLPLLTLNPCWCSGFLCP